MKGGGGLGTTGGLGMNAGEGGYVGDGMNAGDGGNTGDGMNAGDGGYVGDGMNAGDGGNIGDGINAGDGTANGLGTIGELGITAGDERGGGAGLVTIISSSDRTVSMARQPASHTLSKNWRRRCPSSARAGAPAAMRPSFSTAHTQ